MLGYGGLLLLRLGSGGLLFLSRVVLLLLLHCLLFGLLLSLFLDLLCLCGRRLAIIVVIAATDERESGRADAGAGAGSQQIAAR